MEISEGNIDKEEYALYEKAQKRVHRIKQFYKHVGIYIVINLLVLIGRIVLEYQVDIESYGPEFKNWLNWNTLLTPLGWGIGLLFHGLYVFKFRSNILEKWEKRKIQELIEQEDELNSHLKDT